MKTELIKGIKVSTEFPPIINSIKLAFQINPKVYFTYGDVLCNPYRLPIPDDIIAHEKVHMAQQGKQPELWWGKYLREPEFRADQEARAYGAQYKWFCTYDIFKNNRERRHQFLMGLARSLSGPLYANCVSFDWALNAIKKYSGVK